jgi:hypothetical protein
MLGARQRATQLNGQRAGRPQGQVSTDGQGAWREAGRHRATRHLKIPAPGAGARQDARLYRARSARRQLQRCQGTGASQPCQPGRLRVARHRQCPGTYHQRACVADLAKAAGACGSHQARIQKCCSDGCSPIAEPRRCAVQGQTAGIQDVPDAPLRTLQGQGYSRPDVQGVRREHELTAAFADQFDALVACPQHQNPCGHRLVASGLHQYRPSVKGGAGDGRQGLRTADDRVGLGFRDDQHA